ncbi:MAG TPA: hypothetical protein DCM67_01050 [Propionibacteriaceae bacterium]|nr:hypothetical protein [Propionibacteriaceae bacterium]
MFVAVVVAVPLAFGFAPSQAQAVDNLNKLAKMVPGVKKAKLKASVQYLAKRRHTSYRKELKAVISSINKEVAYNKKRRRIAGAMSAGGFTVQEYSVPARTAKWAGDIFVSTLGSQSGGVNFGHTGLYYRQASILHAPGAGKKAQIQPSRSVQVGVGTVYMTTVLSIQKQYVVADYAKATYEGQNYNYMYYTNKFRDGTTVHVPMTPGIPVNLNPAKRANCSELVWGSYKNKAGIDLDGYTAGNGDYFAVFPWDIERSGLTSSYVP